MRVYKIGIIGHRPHRFTFSETVRKTCAQVALTLMDQYAPNQVRFNLNGLPGAGQWFGQACLEYGINYHLFLPCDPAAYVSEWYQEQKDGFEKQLAECYGLTLANKELSKDTVCEAAQMLVDDSDFVVAFWEGYKSGLTYETIKYGVETSKLVLDGARGLTLIAKKELVKDAK